MARSGEYSDVLRAVGRVLDQQQAREVEIVDEGTHLGASWQTTDGGGRVRRTYRSFELDRLRLEARLLRKGEADGVPQTGLSEMLRIIGAELDRTETEFLSVVETETGFQVSTMVRGRHTSRTYTQGEIRHLGLEQRARRRPILEQVRSASN
jgi:hypothetical protein